MDTNSTRKRSVANIKINKIRKQFRYDRTFSFIESSDFYFNNEDKLTDMSLKVKNEDSNGNYVRKNFRCKRYVRVPYITLAIDALPLVNKLSVKAFKLFYYIVNKIIAGTNAIELTKTTVADVIDNNNDQVVSITLGELVKIRFIAKSPLCPNRRVFTINHNLFFKGDYNRFIDKYLILFGDEEECENINIDD